MHNKIFNTYIEWLLIQDKRDSCIKICFYLIFCYIIIGLKKLFKKVLNSFFFIS